MKLYLVRHGESVCNVERMLYGRTDCALTDKGREAARPLDDIIHRVLDEAGSELGTTQRVQMYDALNHILDRLRTYGR